MRQTHLTSNARILFVDIPKLDGFPATKFDILKSRWLPTVGFFGVGPQCDDVDAAIGLSRGDVDGAHDAAGGAVPGQAEVAGAALDRADDLVGDVLMNIEVFLIMAVPRCVRAARLRPRGAKGT